MTQEDKELLLKDLCGRLPYGIKCKDQYGEYIDINIYNAHIEHLVDQISSGEIKMVLRPMSSMTEEEYKDLCNSCTWLWFKNDLRTVTHGDYKCYDWLNAHHFDYRGLIEKGLALEAPEGMYNLNK